MDKRGLFWVTAILALGAALRIYGLGQESLWFDEIASIDQATRDLPSLFFKFHLSPAYFFLLRYWIKLFGIAEFGLRFPSVIFGIASLWLVYAIGKRLFSRNVGLIAGLLMSVSTFHIFYSQEARAYSLFTFFTLLSVLFFLRIARDAFAAGRRTFIMYGIATVLLLYTHLWGIFVVLVENICYFVYRPQEKRKWLVTQAIIFVVFLFWLIPFFMLLAGEREYVFTCIDWIPRPTIAALLETFKAFSYGGLHVGGNDVYMDPVKLKASLSLAYILPALFIFGLHASRKADSRSAFFLGTWLLLPIVTLVVFSTLFFSVFVARYFIFVLPAFLLLAARGVEGVRKKVYRYGLLAGILLLTAPALHFYYSRDLKIKWDAMLEYIGSHRKENDVIVLMPSEEIPMFSYPHLKITPQSAPFHLSMIKELGVKMYNGGFIYSYKGQKVIGIQNTEQLKELLRHREMPQGTSLFFISTRWAESPETVERYLSSVFTLRDKASFEGIKVYVYTL